MARWLRHPRELRQDPLYHCPAQRLAVSAGHDVRPYHTALAYRHGWPAALAQVKGRWGMKAKKIWKRLAGRPGSSNPPRGPVRSDAAEHGPDGSHGYILYLEDLTVSFDGFRALNDLTLYVETGELRCIIGPNGAGKTTMMGCHHRQDAPRPRHCLVRAEPRPARADRARNRRSRHRPQVPEAHRVRKAHRFREPGAGTGRQSRGVGQPGREAVVGTARSHQQRAAADRPCRCGRYSRRRPLTRPEAVARDRHAADAEPAAAAGG